MSAFPVHCTGCRRPYSAEEWSQLPIAGPPHLEGLQEAPAGDGEEARLYRMRNCSRCLSTFMVDTRDELEAGILPPGHERRDDDFMRRLTAELLRNGVPISGRTGVC